MSGEERALWRAIERGQQSRTILLVAADWYAESTSPHREELEFALRWAACGRTRPDPDDWGGRPKWRWYNTDTLIDARGVGRTLRACYASMGRQLVRVRDEALFLAGMPVERRPRGRRVG